ncbi:AMP-binding protein [Actinomadura sp. WMMB 499]|uniref:AMP-binding protein n=1 Tax=Actinomadura sp. WMMB 499 TaxID=1219491 RepID=UPI001246EAF2|nr:AMP-binding protein [Actinomadura sp. WMMB 499]QFG22170.1 long-chain fatty acid--CoA ligase [Actinomadura sp. WMMB 499]
MRPLEPLQGRSGTAMRRKRLGVWEEITWPEYVAVAERVAGALRECGVGEGDRIALAVRNRPEWLFAELGIVLAGAVAVPLDVDGPPERLVEAKARLLFADDAEQVDKALSIAGNCPDLGRIVVIDARDVSAGDERVVTFADFGAGLTDAGPSDAGPSDAGPSDAASKDAARLDLSAGDPFGLRARDEYLSFMPTHDAAERAFSLTLHLSRGYIVNFGGAATVHADLAAVRPTVLYARAEVWEELRHGAQSRLAAASWLKRRLSTRALAGGLPLGSLLIHRPLRARLGLGRVRIGLYGPGPFEGLSWYERIGLRMKAYETGAR